MPAFVVILMGSSSDMAHAQTIQQSLNDYGIEAVLRVGSAHKTPAHVMQILESYEADPNPKVYITIAGRSNALSGFVDAQVRAPVIACPPLSSTFAGADIYSSLRMPSGVAPAVVLEPTGAALLAAKILALSDPAIQQKLAASQQQARDKILQDDEVSQQRSLSHIMETASYDQFLDDRPHEECGVFGVYAPGRDVARLTFFGLYALQHRGQESAGIATSDGQRALIHRGHGAGLPGL